MPTTRKKVIKTVYKDEDDSEAERAAGDFSDSGSDAQISECSSSDEERESDASLEEFDEKSKKKFPKAKIVKKKTKFAKELIGKISKQMSLDTENGAGVAPALFSVKDLTDADKLLPSFLNLSESDSSEDDNPKPKKKLQNTHTAFNSNQTNDSDCENEGSLEYKDVWSNNIQDNSEEVARKTFMELEQHKCMIEEAKASILNYSSKPTNGGQSEVKDLLALGEEVLPQTSPTPVGKGRKAKKRKDDSDSEVEDWEEVKETKAIPQQGLQVVVNFPDATSRKTKKLDLEMMMKRRINRVKKEYQVYMHKVHVLCWLGHGNYVSRVLNDQEVLAAALSLVPSKECYPGERVDMKYVEQITTWYKDKLTLKQDKNEDKFRPKAPPLKEILLGLIKSRVVTTKKYLVFVFVSMLRALGLQCRVMFNFVALPIKPPSTELCSLATKKEKDGNKEKEVKKQKAKKKDTSTKSKTKTKISQVDGNDDTLSCYSDFENIVQVDGNDDVLSPKLRSTRTTRAKKNITSSSENQDVSPPKRARKSLSPMATKVVSKKNETSNQNDTTLPQKRKRESKLSHGSETEVKKEFNNTSKDQKQLSTEVNPRRRRKLSDNDETSLKKTQNKLDDGTEKLKPLRNPRKTRNIIKNTSNADDPIDKNPEHSLSKNRSQTATPHTTSQTVGNSAGTNLVTKTKTQTKSASVTTEHHSKYFNSDTANSADNNKPKATNSSSKVESEDKQRVSPRDLRAKSKANSINDENTSKDQKQLPTEVNPRRRRKLSNSDKTSTKKIENKLDDCTEKLKPLRNPRTTRNISKNTSNTDEPIDKNPDKIDARQKTQPKLTKPQIIVNDEDPSNTSSKYFDNTESSKSVKRLCLSRNRSQTATPHTTSQTVGNSADTNSVTKTKTRTKSAPGTTAHHSKCINSDTANSADIKKPKASNSSSKVESKDKQRVSHRDLRAKSKANSKNDVTGDLVDIIKKRVKEAKEESKKGIVKGKAKQESDGDSDYLPEEAAKHRNSDSDEDFKPTKLSPKPGPSISRKIDRRVLSSDDDTSKNKCNVWCEVFVEELEQWISIDVIKGKVHCTKEIYASATHPVCYVVGWDNNNYLKDVTRRYVPHWNTVTRKQRAESAWWDDSLRPWLGPKTGRDKEEDEQLKRMQLEAPLPKSIAEYKNHPLYVLKRHLLKYEAIYPPDAATLGFVRNEPVYARECVYVCHSRDTWLREAKVVRMGEQPYKFVKARPRWDKVLSKIITDLPPCAIFGPWQVQDFEPPVAENGIVPRNAYGNVELFKICMLPKGTVHIKLPGLNRVAKKLNIDCAPALTGFDGNCGWPRAVYDGFVVCKEYEEIIQEAWAKDQEDQERKELEKMEARVYGNWKRLIKGLLIKQRLKNKYGFEDPSTSKEKKKKNAGPRLVVKKKN